MTDDGRQIRTLVLIYCVLIMSLITVSMVTAFCCCKGYAFRATLKSIREVRSLLPLNVHVMVLTATATRKLQVSVESILGMKNPASVIIVPYKPNIMYAVGIFKSVRETFAPILERLRRERHLMPRMIVYCRTYDMCSDLFMYFKSCLGNNFTEPPNSVELNKHGLS